MKLQNFEQNESIISREDLLNLKGGSSGDSVSLSTCTNCDVTSASITYDCGDGDAVID